MRKILRCAIVFLLIAASGAQAHADRDQFLELARKGWVYQLRSAMTRPGVTPPVIRINSQDMAGAALCIVGEPPHPQTRRVLDAFSGLVAEIFNKPMPMRFGGTDLAACGTGRIVYLRLYSGLIPHRAFNNDLRRIDRVFDIGLPHDREQFILSPAQAQTFFGRNGRATHLLVKQPLLVPLSQLEQRFFASILIEELYQSFTFGIDILHFDRNSAFVSKLEEFPINLRHIPWDSPIFMQGLLQSNPAGLCRFDVFMLHALALAPVEQTNTEAFLQFIEGRFDDLMLRAEGTIAQADHAPILDQHCRTSE
ncbi:hypothetical protein [uncultured Roseovarius sp.]|uniref:hypothetical protein n=1 Tax=uncultured Roseovarius sp. TaxID=293344 RepID=UPI00263499BD|nr:hypothetical protein [uncultured Roseovarius sp.]